MTEAVLGKGKVQRLALRDRNPIDVDIVVFSAGIRPRDELARAAGLDVAERGGVLVERRCGAPTEHISAIGECAAVDGRMYGLVAPGYDMAEIVVDRLLGGDGVFTGADMSTKLKLMGVDVASFGDAFAATDGRPRARLLRRRRRASTRSSSSPRTASSCSAASWSATRRRTACSGRWSPPASSCPTTRRT